MLPGPVTGPIVGRGFDTVTGLGLEAASAGKHGAIKPTRAIMQKTFHMRKLLCVTTSVDSQWHRSQAEVSQGDGPHVYSLDDMK